jgi:ABC-type polysaccharide/polyol phosphate transport system ATPase subunit
LRKQGKTIIFVSHSAEDIRTICGGACALDDGLLRFLGKPPEAIEWYHQLLTQ